jgi:hypothetical protein
MSVQEGLELLIGNDQIFGVSERSCFLSGVLAIEQEDLEHLRREGK